MSAQDEVFPAHSEPDAKTEATSEPETTSEHAPPKLPRKLIYTNEGFEQFLQQAELSGISRDRQDELLAMFLAQDVSLEAVILSTFSRTVELLKRNKLRVLVLMVVMGLVGFVWVNEYRAKRGYQEYKPWQFEMSAQLKLAQIKYLSWFDWGVVNEECYLPNPYFYLRNRGDEDLDIDCEKQGRELTFTYASAYTGVFNNKKFPLPLLLNEAQEGWTLSSNSTLEDLHKILAVNLNHYPCVNYVGNVAAGSDFEHDPVRALIDGKLAKQDGTALNVVFLDGCSRDSNKILRGLTKRPQFLDPHIEALQSVKGIVTKGIPKGKSAQIAIRPHDPDIDRSNKFGYYWLANVIGTTTITVKDLDCPDNKPNVYTMQPGDIVSVGPEDSLELEIPGPEESFLLYTNFRASR